MTTALFRSTHPLHLLDDLLASLSPSKASVVEEGAPTIGKNQDEDGDDPDAIAAEGDASTSLAEAKQDVVLKAAGDLFCNNISLLENALSLLDEQEQCQTSNITRGGDNAPPAIPVIRKIRARCSGREVILVRKQRKKSAGQAYKAKFADNNTASSQMTDAKEGDKQQQNIMDDYYLCLLGRDQIDRRALFTNNDNHGWAKIQRRGMHCTCRSFFQNMKGGSRSSSSSKANEPTSFTTDDVVVCKHLLAAILMPHLLPWSSSKIGEVEGEVVDDREFAKLVVHASIG